MYYVYIYITCTHMSIPESVKREALSSGMVCRISPRRDRGRLLLRRASVANCSEDRVQLEVVL